MWGNSSSSSRSSGAAGVCAAAFAAAGEYNDNYSGASKSASACNSDDSTGSPMKPVDSAYGLMMHKHHVSHKRLDHTVSKNLRI